MDDSPHDDFGNGLGEEYQSRWGNEQNALSENITVRRDVDEEVWKYSKEIPDEIKRAVEGIDGEIQYAILVLLIEEGGAPFSKIEDELNIHQQTLSTRLKKLGKGALITRRERGGLDDRYEANYEITEFGRRFLNHLLATLNTESRIKPNWKQSLNIGLEEEEQGGDWGDLESQGLQEGLQEAPS